MKKLLIGSILILVLSGQAHSAMTILETVEKYRSIDPNYTAIKLELKKTDYIVDENLPSRAAILSFTGEKGFTNDSELDTEVLSGGLEKDLIETGTKFSATHTQTKRPDREENVTELRVEQSLYKNGFGKDTRILKQRLEKERKLKRLEVEESLDEYYAVVLKKLLNFDRAKNALELATFQRNESKKIAKTVNEKLRAKIASTTDLKRSQLQILLSEKEILDKKQERDIIEGELLDGSTNAKLDLVKNATRKLIENLERKADFSSPSNSRTAEMIKTNRSIAKEKQKLASRLTRPDLRLVAGYNVDDSTRFGSQTNREEKVLGLKLIIPFGDSKTKAMKQSALVDSMVQEAYAKQINLDQNWKRNELRVQLREMKERLEIGNKKATLVESIMKDEKRRYNIGKIDLEKLIEIRETFVTSKIEIQQTRLEYASLLIDWLTVNGNLASSLGLTKL